MKKYYYIIFSILLVVLACNKPQNQTNKNNFAPKRIEAKGYIVPKDSMSIPKVILVDENKLKKIPVGKPKVVPTNTNIHIASEPKIVVAGTPKIITLGQGNFILPKKVPAIKSTFVAGAPEVTLANDPHINDNNPQSFSSFSKLQGLKHDIIRCMLQDKNGNLWFGTDGGASKYDGKSFTHFTVEAGLRNNIVWSILEDRNGNLWFGTDDGVSMYDGKSFTHFNKAAGLIDNTVWSILEDKSGNLWFGTYGGVSKYDGKCFTHFTEETGLSNNNVLSIFEDKNGNLWFGTDGGGVNKYDGKSFTHFTEETGLSNNSVWSILEDKNGSLWFGTNGGVSKYNGKSFTHFTEATGLSNNSVLSISEDNSGNLWFGTDDGVCMFDKKSFTHFTEETGLSNNTVLSILEDQSGNLWFGTNGGVSKYNGKSFTHFNEATGLSNNSVLSVIEDKSGNLWFGTDGGGVNKYDGKSFTHFTETAGLSNNTIWSILEDKSGNLWLGTDGGGVNKYDGKSFTHFTETAGLSDNTVWSILEDRSGNLWFGTYNGVSKYDGKTFTHFTEAEGLSNNTVLSILEDKSGNLWFGTYGGVSKYDGKSFTHFTEEGGLSNNTVLSILEDKSGNLWFGTDGGGVNKYDGKFFTHFTEETGLSDNTVLSILEDNSGNLWFGTRFGLSGLELVKLHEINNVLNSKKINESYLFFKKYNFDDGFYGIGCNGGNSGHNILQDKNGTIWLGANDRLTAFHPKSVELDDIPPNIQLTSISLFNEHIAWANLEHKKDTSILLGNGVSVGNFQFDGISKWYCLPENLSLAYNNNYLTFNFIGIKMMQPKKVKYRYKLEGLDENWSSLSNRTEAPYGNIPPGTYTFKVKAMNSEGYWSEIFEYTFTIRPPWWKTWWAYGIYFIVVIGSIWYYIKWRERALKERQLELEHTVEVRTAEVVEEKKLVEEKNHEILDSINYAKRIQTAILPQPRVVKEFLKSSFVLYIPKDIVAGDFYWMENMDQTLYIAACDCTGHGVPGALVSLVCNNALNRALNEYAKRLPGEIFDKTRELVIENFAKSDEEVKDGMDASLAALDVNSRTLLWAGANNPLWIIKKDLGTNEYVLNEIKADKQPIGKGYGNKPFTTHQMRLNEGDIIYLFTDGYPDQFGGEKNKKMTKAKFRELLLSLAHLPMEEQRMALFDFHEEYRGNEEQVDDICVIGVRV